MNAPSATALDEPVRAALDGPHAHLAVRHGRAVRYHPDVAPFLAPPRDEAEWADAVALAGAGGVVVVRSPAPLDVPPDWEIARDLPGVQMVLGDDVPTPADPDLDVLGAPDVDAMLALVGRTQPGPFARRTHELGTYLGVHDDLAGLVAMAGERLRVPGGTEISAVCTDAAARGRGLATRLVLAVAAGIRSRGELPFLHASATNTTAIRLYEELGFVLRAEPAFVAVRAPSHVVEPALTEETSA
ncbi:GNAT family N-acetyltransferase [Actinomycetospora sp. TBRC 11914]|uniref:GNAT family N-acetyltransferase n=1 Tax=Actinomycetospora sp. TBRC 11914 TaxID=2729387 RepID=UPI00145D6108|nr:GNAT family N-acetyltransferase [Actinomycetospora sp. TBRC 11914]NMO91529.1 GNAT family N-acetyltransferase [Actinomycetospora sp. TBRC 11914]